MKGIIVYTVIAGFLMFNFFGCSSLPYNINGAFFQNPFDAYTKQQENEQQKIKEKSARLEKAVKENDGNYLAPRIIGAGLCVVGGIWLGVSAYNDALPKIGNDGAGLACVIGVLIGMLPGLLVLWLADLHEENQQKQEIDGR